MNELKSKVIFAKVASLLVEKEKQRIHLLNYHRIPLKKPAIKLRLCKM